MAHAGASANDGVTSAGAMFAILAAVAYNSGTMTEGNGYAVPVAPLSALLHQGDKDKDSRGYLSKGAPDARRWG